MRRITAINYFSLHSICLNILLSNYKFFGTINNFALLKDLFVNFIDVMDSTDSFLRACRVNENHPSVTERYFKPTIFPNSNQCSLLHSNRLSIITLAPNHPILCSSINVNSVKFYTNDNVSRLSNKVSGKRKKGGQKLQKNSILCTVSCSNGEEYELYSCVSGKLVEINDRLIENPQLLKEKPWSDGYIAIIMPPFVSSRTKHVNGNTT